MINTVSTPTARSLSSLLVTAAVLLALLFLDELVLPRGHHPPSMAGKPVEAHVVRLAAPSPEPQTVQPLTPAEAIALNATRPLRKHGLELASAFDSGGRFTDLRVYRQAVDCLTAAIYYEASGESEQGQRAIAQVVLNRVRHPSFPSSICAVVYQGSERSSGCQFTFTCDGSLARRPDPAGWDRARKIAEHALDGTVEPSVGMATHYHAQWVVPYWAPGLEKIAQVGQHIFYRWPGFWGLRQSFTQRYAGETIPTTTAGPSGQDRFSAQSVDLSDLVTLPSSWSHINPGGPSVADDETTGAPTADNANSTPLMDGKEYRLIADAAGRLAIAPRHSDEQVPSIGSTLDGCATSEHRRSCLSASEH